MSVLDITRLIMGSAKSKDASAELQAESNRCEFAEQLPLPGEHIGPTQTELANYHFYLEVRKIEGVQVSVSGGETWGEATIAVTIPDLLDKKADEISELELRIYDRYPSGRLNVYVWETASNA